MANENNESKFFHPSVTADIVAVKDMKLETETETCSLKMLLIRRSESSGAFPGAWALPGGFMDNDDKNIMETAVRELREETGVTSPKLTLAGTFTDKGRDPRGPVHSTAFVVTVPPDTEPVAGDDAAEAKWFGVEYVCKAATDHIVSISDAEGKGCLRMEVTVKTNEYGMEDYDIVKLYAADGTFSLAFDHDRIIVKAILRLLADVLVKAIRSEMGKRSGKKED